MNTARGIKVTSEDLETGESRSAEIPPGQYVLVCAEPKYLDGFVTYANGTVVLTLKNRAAAERAKATQ